MKTKNINFVEQHIEKMVLGAVVAICLVVLWVFVVSDPYKVKLKVGPRTEQAVPVDEVEGHAVTALRRLQMKLTDKTTQIPERVVTGWTKSFQNRSQLALTAFERFGPLGEPGLDPNHVKPPEATERPNYLVIKPPAPTKLKVRPSQHVMLPHEYIVEALLARVDQERTLAASRSAREGAAFLAGAVPEAEPRDFTSVTVMAEFDMEAYEKLLLADDSAGRLPPETWWRGRLLLAGLVLERQTRDAQSGQWPDDDVFDVVEPVPGAISFQESFVAERQWDALAVSELVEDIRLAQDQVARHEFVPITEANPWLPPDEVEADLTEQQQRDLFKINTKMDRLRKQLVRLLEQQEKVQVQMQIEEERKQQRQENEERRGRRNDSRDASRTQRSSGAEFGGRRQTRRENRRELTNREFSEGRRGDSDESRVAGKIASMTIELEDLLQRKDDILYPVEEGDARSPRRQRRPSREFIPRNLPGRGGFGGFGGGGMGLMGEMPMRGGFRGRSEFSEFGRGRPTFGRRLIGREQFRRPANRQMDEQRPEEEFEPLKIDLWSHDISVMPGRTYRYRLRVRVFNPFFQQELLTPEQYEQYAGRLALVCEPTDWTEPVEIEPKLEFFVVLADSNNRRVDIEVYRMFDGKRRVERFTIFPGDPIGHPVKVDIAGRTQTVDMHVPAVAVDVEYREARRRQLAGSSNVLIFFDEDTQSLAERSAEADKNDPRRMRYRNEVAQTEAEEEEEPLRVGSR